MLNQLGVRKSIIHQGEAHVQKMNERRILELATFDNRDRLPTQIWYDQLRDTDDGSFSRVTCLNPDKEVDYQTAMPNFASKVREKILTPRIAKLQEKILTPRVGQLQELEVGPLDRVKSPVNKVVKAFEKPTALQRPFNS